MLLQTRCRCQVCLSTWRPSRNEDNAWDSYQSDAEFLRYPSADAIGDLIVDVLDQAEEPQPIAEADQIAADWWDRTFKYEESYSGFVALLSASLKTTDMPSLLAEADKLFADINIHREHPLIKELDHLAILGRRTLQGGWRALPQLAEAMRSYATELTPLPFPDALEADPNQGAQPSSPTDVADFAQGAEDPASQIDLIAADAGYEGQDRPESFEAAPEADGEVVNGHTDVHSTSEHAMDAFEADQVRVDAAKALRAAESNLSKAKHNLRNAQDILDGKYDLITGERKSTGEKVTVQLRGQSGTSEDDALHEEYMAMWYDEDGDEVFPFPRPSLRDYDDARNRQRVFDDHFAEWQAGETARIARAEKNKRRIWETEFAAKRDQLRAINKLDVGQIIGDVLKLARSVFDWLRERVLLARNILSEKHVLTKQMKADWGETLAENKKTHDLVVADHQQQKREADTTAHGAWDLGKTAWVEVEQKREEQRTIKYKQSGKFQDNGPGF